MTLSLVPAEGWLLLYLLYGIGITVGRIEWLHIKREREGERESMIRNRVPRAESWRRRWWVRRYLSRYAYLRFFNRRVL